MSATTYTCELHNWIGCLVPCPMCAMTATEPGRAFFDDPSGDIQLPNGPLSFVSKATADGLAAENAALVAERDEAIRERDAAEFMRDQAKVAVAELAEIHEALMDDWMSRESMTAAECVRRLIGERDAARKERDRYRELFEARLPRTDNLAYDLRQRLNRAVRWLREAEDIARIEMPAWPTADRIRDIYEQVTEDVLNGRVSKPPLLERLRAAEAALDPSPSPEPPITGSMES